jgi:AmmeMemoRadiSam system protein A
MAEMISDEAREYLLGLARKSIALKLEGKDYPRTPPDEPVLSEPCGAFVTLRNGEALRGCIGRMESERPLWETVAMMARAAAFDDPRFAPVANDELDGLSLEVSVLTPFERVEPPITPDAVEIGKHGLLIEKGVYRGVLLPQVAVSQGWGAEEFLENVCLKAALPVHAWKDPDTRLYVFSALIIEE